MDSNNDDDDLDKKQLEDEKLDIDNLIDEIKKDDNFGKAIETIFSNEKDPNIIKEKIILLLQKYLKNKSKDKDEKEIEEQEKQVEKDISRVSKKFIDKLTQQNNINMTAAESRDSSEIKAKNDFKRVIKNFIIYEIYKVVNPKRIAGETKKDNYKHNLTRGGEKCICSRGWLKLPKSETSKLYFVSV